MANARQLQRLKKGVDTWNKWRAQNLDVAVDLSEANLRGMNLREANFNKANLSKANLGGANLQGAYFIGADLSRAKIRKADLSGSDFDGAHLHKADLRGVRLLIAKLRDTNLNGANLQDAWLNDADFHYASLEGTNLKRTILQGTNFTLANLFTANLTDATMGSTILGGIDLSNTLGLNEIFHSDASTIGADTIQYSMGKIPEVFLRGCGLSDWEIEQVKLHNPDLSNEEINNIQYKIYDLRASQALQISPLFVSYSHVDGSFVGKLEKHLNAKGIRFWRDIHDMKSGRTEKQIDRAIRQHPTVLLVLSIHSLGSDWVEHEVRTARQLEKEMKRDVLCPVALDDSWKSSHWPKRIMEQITEYNILDFSAWKEHSKFKKSFNKLIDGLELFYK